MYQSYVLIHLIALYENNNEKNGENKWEKVGGTKVTEKVDNHCCAPFSGVFVGLVTLCTILSVMDVSHL